MPRSASYAACWRAANELRRLPARPGDRRPAAAEACPPTRGRVPAVCCGGRAARGPEAAVGRHAAARPARADALGEGGGGRSWGPKLHFARAAATTLDPVREAQVARMGGR